MRETWLRSNTRVRNVVLGSLVAFDLLATTLLLVHFALAPNRVLLIAAGGMLILSQLLLLAWAIVFRLPRIAYEPGFLLLYLRWSAPVRVPIEIVEGFLLGQGPTMLPGASRDWETSTLVIKLSDRAAAWQQVDVAPAIAAWCNGYVTIRGTWCEPLDIGVVTRLNQRLSEVQPARGERVKR